MQGDDQQRQTEHDEHYRGYACQGVDTVFYETCQVIVRGVFGQIDAVVDAWDQQNAYRQCDQIGWFAHYHRGDAPAAFKAAFRRRGQETPAYPRYAFDEHVYDNGEQK